jgi:hypothetical protein
VTHRLRVERLEARDLPATSFQSLPIHPFQDLAVLDHVRAIAALGQQIGRRSDVVLKIGDSNSSPFPTPHFLAPLGSAAFDPIASGLAATHPELLDTWWDFRTAPNSLAREGQSAWPGLRTPQALASLGGEIKRLNPGVALVMIGTNDAMVTRDASLFRVYLGQMVETLLASRVVPVLSTIPDSHYSGGAYQPILMAFNQIIADVADRYTVPLWNAWASLHRLPNHGLQVDGVHLNASPTGAASLWPADLLYAQNARNLQALRLLDWFRERVSRAALFAAPQREWEPMVSGRALYAVARDSGSSPRVDIYDADGGRLVNRFLAFGPAYTLGVRVATGDVDGDGFTDIVCSTTHADRVRVISGADGTTLARLMPFQGPRTVGLRVAVGDLDGDGAAEIVVMSGSRDPVVRVYGGDSLAVQETFHPFASPTRAASVAVADVEGLGPVIVVAAGRENPTVSYFAPAGQLKGQFALAEGPGRRLTVVAADLNADGFDEIVVGRTGRTQRISLFHGANLLAERDLGPVADGSFEMRLGVLRSRDEGDLLLIGSAPGAAVEVRAFDDLAGEPTLLPLERANRAFGIFVG